MTRSGIHRFASKVKIASISEECSRDCFDFDRLSSCSYGRLVLEHEQTEVISRSREDFPSLGSNSTPRCNHHTGRICQLQLFQGSQIDNFTAEMYLLNFPPKSPTEILKLAIQTRHASELAGFAALFLEPKKSSFVTHSFDST